MELISARLRSAARWGMRIGRKLRTAVLCNLAGPLARRRSPWRLVWQWPEFLPQFAGQVALFAHQDAKGEVRDYVFDLLAALRDAGFQIVFVSNAGQLQAECLPRLQDLCAAVLVRRNLGGCWGAWREALHAIDARAITRLVLTNDDHYGPFGDLGGLLNRTDTAVWAMTDSWQIGWHLRPGLIAVSSAVTNHPAWREFWSQLPVTNLKTLLQIGGDVAFSQRMLRAGFDLAALYRFHELCAMVELPGQNLARHADFSTRLRYWQLKRIDDLIQRQVPFDPTQLLWRQLLRAGAPLLSRTLLQRNPDGTRDLFDCTAELAARGCDSSALARDLVAPLPHQGIRPIIKAITHGGWEEMRRLRRSLMQAPSLTCSLFRSPYQARLTWPDQAAAVGRRVMVFAHFDGSGDVRPHLQAYLRALREASVSIVFVSNAGQLKPAALEALKKFCVAVVVRHNVGYDFGAWREGLAYLKGSLDDIEWLALANDSVYAPVAPLAPLLDRLDFAQADIWGFTSSDQICDHLQSYFLAVSPRVMRSQAWRDFWAGVRPVNSKSWAIAHGELHFSRCMRAAGFHLLALFPHTAVIAALESLAAGRLGLLGSPPQTEERQALFDSLRLRRQRILTGALLQKRTLNPTADLWRELLGLGFPFIKRELLRLNPSHVADSLDWRAEIEPRNPELAALIEADLRQSVRGRIV